MNRRILIPAIILIVVLISLSYYMIISKTSSENTSNKITGVKLRELEALDYIKIVIVVDNDRCDSILKATWGVSIYVETKYYRFLFDLGPDPDILEYNMRVLNIDPSKLNFLIISHEHFDHIGGFRYIASVKPGIKAYIPADMSKSVIDMLSKSFNITKVSKPTIIAKGLISDGELYGGVYEQSIALYLADRGLIVITGCAHPRIEYIVKYFHNITGLPIYAVIGGFHLIGASSSRLNKIVEVFKELNVRFIFPIHCSGEAAREYFASRLESVYVDGKVGTIIIFTKSYVKVLDFCSGISKKYSLTELPLYNTCSYCEWIPYWREWWCVSEFERH